MPAIPRRYAHYVFGFIQSGLTCAVTAAIASVPFWSEGAFASHAIRAWLIAWCTMVPVVLLAAPVIRRIVDAVPR